MQVGIPREIKNNENRVAMTPACVHDLTAQGAQVTVETGAGLGSGFSDEDYRAAGAVIGTAADAWSCRLVVKVKEPQPSDLDNQIAKLARLEEQYQSRVRTLFSNRKNLDDAVTASDAVISTVLVPGARAPHLVTADMVRRMPQGSVIVDIAIDQGGSVETIPHSTTHDDPILLIDGVTHYAVANMPGAVPRTATTALSNATLPYVLLLAEHGLEALDIRPELARAILHNE